MARTRSVGKKAKKKSPAKKVNTTKPKRRQPSRGRKTKSSSPDDDEDDPSPDDAPSLVTEKDILYQEMLQQSNPGDLKIALAISKLDEASDTKALANHLSQWGLSIVPTERDGDCFLHALIDMLQLDMTTDRLRAILIQILRRHQNNYVDASNSEGERTRLSDHPTPGCETWNDYLRTMSIPGEWCDEKMVLAATIYLQRSIVIVSSVTAEPRLWKVPSDWNITELEEDAIVVGHYHERHYVGSALTSNKSNKKAKTSSSSTTSTSKRKRPAGH